MKHFDYTFVTGGEGAYGSGGASGGGGSTGGGGGSSHTHANKEVLDGITAEKVGEWDAAHTHISKTDNPHSVTWGQVKPQGGVPATDLATAVQTALNKAHEHANKTSVLDKLKWDATNNAIYIGDANDKINFYAYGEVTAGGVGSGGSGGTGALYTCADVTAYNNSKVGRSTTEGAQVGDLLAYDGTHWHAVVAPATGVTKLINRTGEITQAQLRSDLGLGNLAYQPDVVTALGYTPYNASNPNGYISEADHIIYRDTRSANPVPYSTGFKKGIEYALKTNSADGLSQGGTYHGVMTLHQWGDASGGDAWQLGFTHNGRIYARHGVSAWSDWSGLAFTSDIPTALSQLSADTTHRLVTDSQITAWNNKWDYNENTIKAVKVNNAGNADTLENHSASYFAAASSLGNYLPLSGGTLSGSMVGMLTLNNNSTTKVSIIMKRGNTSVAEFGNYHLWGGAFMQDTSTGYSISVSDKPYFRGAGNYEIYHSGNANNASAPWEAASLTLHGTISGATTVTASSHIYTGGYLYSSKSGTNRTVIEFLDTGVPLFGYGTCGASLDTHIYGNIIGFHTSSSRGEKMRIDSSGNVGIGTTSPSAKLHITGNATEQNQTDLLLESAYSSTSASWNEIRMQRNVSYRYAAIRTNYQEYAVPQSVDFVFNYQPAGQETTVMSIWYNYSSPTASAVYINGNIVATGEITAGGSSDARFKDNQQALHNADAVLKSLRPMEFDWNDLYHSLGGRNEGHDVGFLAQDVQPLIPSAIGKVYGDYLRLDNNKVTPYLVAGWQSHETRIERLEWENRELRQQIQRLQINS